jgi:hypothetical protein
MDVLTKDRFPEYTIDAKPFGLEFLIAQIMQRIRKN